MFYAGSRAKIFDFDRDDERLFWNDSSKKVSDIKFLNVVVDVEDRTTSSGKDFIIRSVDLVSKDNARVYLRDTDGHVFKDHVSSAEVASATKIDLLTDKVLNELIGAAFEFI